MKILALYDRSGPKYHRILLPCYLMEGVELVVNSKLIEEQVADCDILFFNRMIHNGRIQDVLDWRDKYGFKIVIDFDDHWVLGPDHLLYESYQEFRLSEFMQAYLEEADLVTVTHERLYDDAVRHNKNVHILPNAIPRWGQFDIKKTDSPFTRLFWAGGVTHKKDIQLLSNPVRRFNFPNTMMVMGGYSEHIEYKAMATAYTNGGKIRHNLIKALPVEDYYLTYQECDIALVPLQDTTFNSHKSNLKILEAANMASPIVVSRVHPYLGFPEDIVNYVSSQGDWYRQVKKLIDNPGMAKEQGEALRDYCNEHYNFEKINKERKQLFEYVTGKQTEVREIQAEVRSVD